MTIPDLDRLVSRTELTPASKAALGAVRQAVMRGRCGDAKIGRGNWAIAFDTDSGRHIRMNFSFKRDSDVVG